jgi:ribosomal protein S18 acetylase RimI-like enzyme
LFENLRNRFASDARTKKSNPVLQELMPEDTSELGLHWNSHFNASTLRNQLILYPGLSLRVRGADEYIIGDLWRRHEGIGHILECRTRNYRKELVAGLEETYRKRGCKALVIANDEYSDNLSFYYEAGFGVLEQIVYYEKNDMQTNYNYMGTPLRLTPFNKLLMQELLKVDHAAFPWLWWNSKLEMELYTEQNDVTVYLAYNTDTLQPVGYFGFTLYERWAHLDRLAVIPDVQGQGIGAYLLTHSVKMMEQKGARRVTLSTQLTNRQSQRLYEGFGFNRVRSLEYNLIGRWLEHNK